ncbi:metallophosphoesterase [Acidithiobacillus ferriphilus]|uniref:metallophosphoesterase n=1 Tax=Acidithiobacillus ferriphilus TaxID=1689834 RepID=UPI001C068C2C|nr:metallophosphoesterase [Acidithiobacillus ferriphilus]MBU2852946.1 metallophosphoesterase [Acidithiobacillus ferriphilus]
MIRQKIQCHEENTLGRDFIVGDLHGCLPYLNRLLAHVHFDPATDRLFSVGDLVNRGPDSSGVLALLAEPWFFPVLGNHDVMMLAFLTGQSPFAQRSPHFEVYGDGFLSNGGRWLKILRPENAQIKAWIRDLINLPLIRVVGQGVSRFHIAHAQLAGDTVDDWSDTRLDHPEVEQDTLWTTQRFIPGFDMTGNGFDAVLWGRGLRADLSNVREITGLSRTYVGHTITVLQDTSRILAASSHVFLDTGAYKSLEERPDAARYGLTLWCHQEDRGWRTQGEKILDVRLSC